MKKFILSFIMIICACTFVFAGCGAKGLKDNPATDANITGITLAEFNLNGI